jgi:hypothetical protein
LPEINKNKEIEFQRRKKDKHERFIKATEGVNKSVGNLKAMFEQMAKEKIKKEVQLKV